MNTIIQFSVPNMNIFTRSIETIVQYLEHYGRYIYVADSPSDIQIITWTYDSKLHTIKHSTCQWHCVRYSLSIFIQTIGERAAGFVDLEDVIVISTNNIHSIREQSRLNYTAIQCISITCLLLTVFAPAPSHKRWPEASVSHRSDSKNISIVKFCRWCNRIAALRMFRTSSYYFVIVCGVSHCTPNRWREFVHKSQRQPFGFGSHKCYAFRTCGTFAFAIECLTVENRPCNVWVLSTPKPSVGDALAKLRIEGQRRMHL